MVDFLEKHADKWEAVTETGCFIWIGALDRRGYGKAGVSGRTMAAYRQALIDAKGPPPPGTEASHLCHTRCCVNPAHLVWETRSENFMRKSPVDRQARAKLNQAKSKGARKSHNRWRIAGRTYIGSFATEAEAVDAYNKFTGRL